MGESFILLTKTKVLGKSDLFKMDVVQDFIGIFATKEVNYDNFTFKMFYRATFGLCVLASLLLGASQYIGDPIECDPGVDDEKFQSVFEDHCWIHGGTRIGHGKPDVQKHFGCLIRPSDKEHTEEEDTTTFYQWIVFVLVISGGSFRLPHIIWKSLEGGLMKSLFSGEAKTIKNKGKEEDSFGDLLKEKAHFLIQLRAEMNWYYFTFVFCEMLNVVLLIVIWSITDQFLSGNFHNYGSEVYGELVTGDYGENADITENRFNVMCNAFPTTITCNFNTTGLAGAPQSKNGICILSQNILNQKVYLVLWFWYILVLSIGVVQIVFEAIVIAVPAFRNHLITWNMGKFADVDIRYFLDRQCNIGDWFVLYQLRKNTDKHFYCLLLKKMAKSVNPKTENH